MVIRNVVNQLRFKNFPQVIGLIEAVSPTQYFEFAGQSGKFAERKIHLYYMSNTVYIVGIARTPVGSFGGSLASVSATQLGATAIKAALERSGVDPENVNEVFMGNVLTANVGQAPARQASKFAGIPNKVPCTTVNKVCASGMKSIMLGANSIRLGDNEIVVAGGMESMSNVPHYLGASRNGIKYGNGELTDGIMKDGFLDVYNNYLMGNAAELCARECNISREDQDTFAIESYKRAQEAISSGKFKGEIVPVSIPQRKGDPIVVDTDEEPSRVNFAKIPTLNPVFEKTGTVTAANASSINDGAAAVVLASEAAVQKYGLRPLAKIVSYADAAKAPEWFTTAPSEAIPKALNKAGLTTADIDLFEINQAFSVVSVANEREMKLDRSKVDIWGGGVSIGHPIGASGARIVVTLLSALADTGGKLGCAGICNGGGGASAIVIERV
jgi:acetyl-CoA C-acetyltransferase